MGVSVVVQFVKISYFFMPLCGSGGEE